MDAIFKEIQDILSEKELRVPESVQKIIDEYIYNLSKQIPIQKVILFDSHATLESKSEVRKILCSTLVVPDSALPGLMSWLSTYYKFHIDKNICSEI